MNEHQRAGLRAIWEVWRLYLIIFGVLGAYFGLGMLMFHLAGVQGIWITVVLFGVSSLAYMSWDSYRRGVKYSKEDARRKQEHEAEMARLRARQ